MDVVRSWKDPEYRASHGEFTAHPSGPARLSRLELGEIEAAGAGSARICGPTATLTLTLPAWCIVSLSLC
ncbi:MULTISPECIES: mersacidin/lichenicidin family type 2 lantibiotic [Actinoalloteichus]|uniref:Type 2 lantibiotic, mersacidin/lichenicidin family n=1 Tax=Actinoalloteichus fjordicus TaxID=1612552 RepID=A0AAC9PRD8_9PSEU|nr:MULTISPECIES: mersacidin/lichenicidin family type 2 lantibiotic [Actinoalloteichus]APU13955.1 type 2 lantibiotic, mersacidin/lichenicidin family [Actinoalloteichus fjordicus]APU19901.1 type 2 lantibiotic, mersacidin/lichenicidin family [Actinoalloteichus sp. GBA129-24]